MRDGIFKNTFVQTLSLAIGYILSFALAPLLLSRLGLAAFGVWAVTGAMATYAGIADLGVARSLQRFIAFYDARGDERAIRECVGLGLLVVTAVGAVAAGVAVLAAPLVAHILGVLAPAQMRTVLLSSAAIMVCGQYRMVFSAIGFGLRRVVPPAVAGMLDSIVNFLFSAAILIVSPSLVHYALANAAAEVVGVAIAIGAVGFVRRPLPVALPSMRVVRAVFSFGVRQQVVWIATLVNEQTDKVVIAALVGVREAGAYEIGARIAFAAQSLSLLMLPAMIPTVTASIAARGRGVIEGFYRRYTRISSGISFPILTLSAITAPYVLVAWLGHAPPNSTVVLVALAFASLGSMTTAVGQSLAFGDGRPGLVARNKTATAALNVALTVGLAPLLGLWGVMLGTCMALSLGALLFVVRFHRAYGLAPSAYLTAVAPPAALALGLAVPFAIADLIVGARAASSRPSAIVALALTAGLYGGAYWLLASRFGCLPERLRLGRPRRGEAATVAAQPVA